MRLPDSRVMKFATWTVFLLGLFAIGAMAQTAPAQGPAGVNASSVLVVNYVKAKEGFVQYERDLWLPIGKAAVAAGNLEAWSVWAVRFSGKNSEYDYVTVDAYKNWNALGTSPYTPEVFAKAHPGKKMEDVSKRGGEVRDMVRREVFRLAAQTEPDANAPSAKYVVVDYYQTAPGKAGDYVRLERQTYLPMHQELVRQGKQVFWQLYRVSGAGTANSYNFITVRGYAKWEDTGSGGFASVMPKVHPNLKMEDVNKQTSESRTLTKQEIMTLVVEARPTVAARR